MDVCILGFDFCIVRRVLLEMLGECEDKLWNVLHVVIMVMSL